LERWLLVGELFGAAGAGLFSCSLTTLPESAIIRIISGSVRIEEVYENQSKKKKLLP